MLAVSDENLMDFYFLLSIARYCPQQDQLLMVGGLQLTKSLLRVYCKTNLDAAVGAGLNKVNHTVIRPVVNAREYYLTRGPVAKRGHGEAAPRTAALSRGLDHQEQTMRGRVVNPQVEVANAGQAQHQIRSLAATRHSARPGKVRIAIAFDACLGHFGY